MATSQNATRSGESANLMTLGVEVENATPAGFPDHKPVIAYCSDLSNIAAGFILSIDGRHGYIRVLFRPDSCHNFIVLTDRCNSLCLMCSQPPIPRDHPEIPDRLLRLIQLIAPLRPEHIAVTGGEPTLLGVGFLETLAALRKYLPETAVSVLTNGRNFKDPDFVRRIAACSEPVRTLFSIPLHADVAKIHNRIAGCQGAFEETLAGLYNSSGKLRLEIRVIIHRLTVPRLRALADFIYSSLPFIRHVIFMGIENIGLARVNSDKLSIGNQEIIEPLAAAVEYLHLRGILVSLYNMQLCLLPRELWGFCRQSISDYKATYADACHACGLLRHCGGIFTSADPVHIASLRPVSSVFPSIDPSLPIYERNSSTRRLEL